MGGEGLKQRQGEKRVDYLNRVRAAQAEARAALEAMRPKKRRGRARFEDDRNANRIDGYDRDNLGESPDF